MGAGVIARVEVEPLRRYDITTKATPRYVITSDTAGEEPPDGFPPGVVPGCAALVVRHDELPHGVAPFSDGSESLVYGLRDPSAEHGRERRGQQYSGERPDYRRSRDFVEHTRREEREERHQPAPNAPARRPPRPLERFGEESVPYSFQCHPFFLRVVKSLSSPSFPLRSFPKAIEIVA
jgi:hypothetical protein